ncbi:hypothetical protein AL755_20825 [Arthrobacter sp. ERGS1:01]|uniref:MarR family winged helix-turn-helix transcriptional regulator n=1 Tax=Arthrobacter sp. ERGS1:01 TaxID=1704044 RepID=UPI0006B46411|nr:MarR family transcriptional regulator [Arthrobacter sp. ERGS1:01]ALE07358.1 hypothetical protein AL755_20825 [Arthrobacter sp. ERGS1:01]
MRSQPADPADLGELFHAAFRGLRRTWADQLSPWDLTPHQWRALSTLLRGGGYSGACSGNLSDGGGLRLKDLADRLRIAPRSATEVVDQLEAKGLVRREPDPTDRRATLVRATAEGEELFAKAGAERREKANEYFGRLSADDQADLARILGQLGH